MILVLLGIIASPILTATERSGVIELDVITDGIQRSAVSPCGNRIITVGQVAIGLEGHDTWSRCCCCSNCPLPNYYDYDAIWALRVWDANTGKELHAWRKARRDTFLIGDPIFSNDGKMYLTRAGIATELENRPNVVVLSCGYEHRIHNFTIALSHQAMGPGSLPTFDPLYDTLFFQVWDTDSGEELLKVEKNLEDRVFFSPDDTKIAISGKNGVVRVYEIASGKQLMKLEGHLSSPHNPDVAFSPDGTKIIVTGGYRIVRFYEIDTGNKLMELEASNATPPYYYPPYRVITFSPDGRTIATYPRQGPTRVWDADSGTLLLDLPKTISGGGGLNSVIFSSDGKKFTVLGNSAPKIYDSRSGRVLQQLGHYVVNYYADEDDLDRYRWVDTGGRVRFASFFPDGKRITVITGDIQIWDTDSGRRLSTHAPRIVGDIGSFSPDGKKIVLSSTSTSDRTQVWDAYSGQELWINNATHFLAFLQNGEKILTRNRHGTSDPYGVTNTTFLILDTQTGKELQRIEIERIVSARAYGNNIVFSYLRESNLRGNMHLDGVPMERRMLIWKIEP